MEFSLSTPAVRREFNRAIHLTAAPRRLDAVFSFNLSYTTLAAGRECHEHSQFCVAPIMGGEFLLNLAHPVPEAGREYLIHLLTAPPRR